ncbi:MAG: hypothetical protein JRN06_03155 [Nitrososphaerota archaeon]|nr:hypothetical protein [Nitrososphaerota archaeon]MDG7023144.1 hypothetical protein [Nitrososphaerota archaeon]
MTVQAPAPEAQPQQSKKGTTKLVVPLVWAVGIFLGVVLSYAVPLPFRFGPYGFFDEFRNLLILHTVLSTVIIALQLALVIVYLRVYADTGARFALGILVVMSALLIQSAFQSPLLLGFVGTYAISFGPYLTSADLFTIAAYSVFLYLSLE